MSDIPSYNIYSVYVTLDSYTPEESNIMENKATVQQQNKAHYYFYMTFKSQKRASIGRKLPHTQPAPPTSYPKPSLAYRFIYCPSKEAAIATATAIATSEQ